MKNLTVRVWNKLMWGPKRGAPTEFVEGAKIYLIPHTDPLAYMPHAEPNRPPDATTNPRGVAQIALAGRALGGYTLRVLPQPSSTEPVGSKFFEAGAMVDRIYRPFDLHVELRKHNVVMG